MATVHVVGAGLAGLAAAVELAGRGGRVALHEAAPQAGGRCRSYHDRALGATIDNGNHLLLSGNEAALGYLATIGAADRLIGPAEACYPFLDLVSGERWTVRPNRGRLPLWLACPGRRVPGTRLVDYLAGGRLARAPDHATVAERLAPAGRLWRRFWDPLATAILNTPPERASARLLWAALRESFAKGGAGCRPLIARHSLADSLVDPALAWLRARGAEIAFGARLRAIEGAAGRIDRLRFAERTVELAPGDRAILALPPGPAAGLLPGLAVPQAHHAIVNGHLRLPRPAALPDGAVLLGLVGGTAQWLFLRGAIASLTVSAADALAELPAEAIAARLWWDTAQALGLPAAPLPPWRIVKEKRATFAQTPAELARRPAAATAWRNLWLAGDWTATGLPATIEGAIRSGRHAARLALAVA
jgi:squalene-associated FAD-dependent desaturase